MRRPALLVILAALACGAGETTPAGEPQLLVEEARFAVWLGTGPGPEGTDGSLRVRVETRGDWHLADDAPVSLRFDANADCRVDPAEQHRDAALLDTRDAFEFGADYVLDGEEAATLGGHAKFGICEGDAEGCAIVRRAFTARVAAH